MAKRSIFTSRNTRTGRTLMGGCFDCYGSDAVWFGPNAQGVAARHHDATGHATWVDVALFIRYGGTDEDLSKPVCGTPEVPDSTP